MQSRGRNTLVPLSLVPQTMKVWPGWSSMVLTRPSSSKAASGQILQILKESDVVVETPNQELDLNDSMLRLLFKIQAWGAAEERKEIMRKTQRGKRLKRERGYWMGAAPFGYEFDKETCTWSFNHDEKNLYLWMVDKFLIDGWSMSKICRYLGGKACIAAKVENRQNNPAASANLNNLKSVC